MATADTSTAQQQCVAIPVQVSSQGVLPSSNPFENKKIYQNALFAFGFVEVTLGGVLGILTIITLAVAQGPDYHFGGSVYCFFGDFITYVAGGIWCGACSLLSGGLGIFSKFKPTAKVYVASMTLAIMDAYLAFVGVILSGIAARLSVCSIVLRQLHIAVACMCFVVMLITIVHSSLCCKCICCDEDGLTEPESSTSQQNVETKIAVTVPAPELPNPTEKQHESMQTQNHAVDHKINDNDLAINVHANLMQGQVRTVVDPAKRNSVAQASLHTAKIHAET